MFDRAVSPDAHLGVAPNTFELFIRPRNLATGQAAAVPTQIKTDLDRGIGNSGHNGAAWVSGGLVRVWYTVTPTIAVDEPNRRALILAFLSQTAATLGPSVAFELVAPPTTVNWPLVIGGGAAVVMIGLVWWGSWSRRMMPNRRRMR